VSYNVFYILQNVKYIIYLRRQAFFQNFLNIFSNYFQNSFVQPDEAAVLQKAPPERIDWFIETGRGFTKYTCRKNR